MSTKNKKQSEKSKASSRMELVKNEGGISKLFRSTGSIDRKNYVIKSRPPTIKPADFPIGQALVGILWSVNRVEGKPDKDGTSKPWAKIVIKGSPTDLGVELTATAVLRSALEITLADDGAHSPYLHHEVTIERLADKLYSKKGNDAWNFIVGISEKPVKLS